MATINKTRPSFARVKVQVDLMSEFPRFIGMEIMNEYTKFSGIEQVKIQYDSLPKYCTHCKVQGHVEEDCDEESQDDQEKIRGDEQRKIDQQGRWRTIRRYWNPTNIMFTMENGVGISEKTSTPGKDDKGNAFASLAANEVDVSNHEMNEQQTKEVSFVPEISKVANQQLGNESTKDWINRAFTTQQERNDEQHTCNTIAAQMQHGICSKDVEEVHPIDENTWRNTHGKEIVAYHQHEDWGDATYVDPLQTMATRGPVDGPTITMGKRRFAPNEALHALVTHQVLLDKGYTSNHENISREDSNEINIEDGEEEESVQLENNIYKEADLYPQMMTRGNKRKGKKAIGDNHSLPWMVGGDFNVIMGEEEKIGGFPIYLHEYEDFSFYINSCELNDLHFSGSPFTWWNGRADEDYIFKRFDRVVASQAM
ncbi:hypothetical protein H5410_046084 [Solanum commersonii]|uniref:Uncharacterized protein n=1 Tax=Solanum commersonii TaxID=4109 RepID=A0A9J5XD53_SOLCO|nr:hypothetical protein H5410_046084 [Solanum commersonii]